MQVRGTVLTVRRVDAYYAMTVVAPGIAARFRPGQFVTLAVGGPATSMLLRRAFSIHDVRPDHGGTVEFVFSAEGPGTGWLAERRSRDVVDITGAVLTKLDGTAKGGIVFRVQQELGVPVKLVGLGEGPDDLAPFEPTAFVDALLG